MIRSAPRPDLGAIVWSRLDDDLSVATRDGDFAGYIDRRSTGAFFVFDRDARHVGTFAQSGAARAALGESVRPVRTPLPRRSPSSALSQLAAHAAHILRKRT